MTPFENKTFTCLTYYGIFPNDERLRSVWFQRRFFWYTYGPLLQNNAVAGGIAFFLGAMAVVFLTQAAALDTPLEQEEWFPKDHLSSGFNDAYATEFLAAETSRYTDLSVVLGQ